MCGKNLKERHKKGNESGKKNVYHVKEKEKPKTREDCAFVVERDQAGVGRLLLRMVEFNLWIMRHRVT